MNSYFIVAMAMMIVMAIAFLMQPLWRPDYSLSKNSRMPYVIAVLLVPALTIVLYVNIGTPRFAVASADVPLMAASMSPASRQQTNQSNVNSVASLVDGLASRLEQNPQDAGGWLLLAKSYKHLDEREKTNAAYERAVSLGRTDPDLEAYLSSESVDSTKFESINGRVTIDHQLASELDGSATVFIVAKAARGSSVPLAVLRTTVATLPFDFSLHDGQAMVAGNELSSADTVIVSAKVSADGDAMSTLPGMEINSGPINTAQPEFVSLHLTQ